VDFEWNEQKRLGNIEKHGVDFIDVVRVFEGRVKIIEETGRDYGEPRYGVFGEFNGVVFYLVYTPRGEKFRIITARRAGRREREEYYQSIA